jgi:regulator of sirC expression with transglutaminase-like and TPR domain
MVPSELEAARAANRARFARLVAHPEAEIDLAAGALAIAADGRPDLDPAPTLRELDRIAELVRIRLDAGDSPAVALGRIHDVLYREVGFHGPSAARFLDARNSLFDRVVHDRVGLPISLAVVELEVAARVGLELSGIGLPGHFIVGGPGGSLHDPAGGGRRLTLDDCQALLRRSVGDGVLLHSGMLRPSSRRAVLARILRNLRAVHLAERNWPAALGIVELLAIVEPTESDHVRDRGLLLGRAGRFSDAIAHLRQYRLERPDAADARDVDQVIGIFSGRRN